MPLCLPLRAIVIMNCKGSYTWSCSLDAMFLDDKASTWSVDVCLLPVALHGTWWHSVNVEWMTNSPISIFVPSPVLCFLPICSLDTCAVCEINSFCFSIWHFSGTSLCYLLSYWPLPFYYSPGIIPHHDAYSFSQRSVTGDHALWSIACKCSSVVNVLSTPAVIR